MKKVNQYSVLLFQAYELFKWHCLGLWGEEQQMTCMRYAGAMQNISRIGSTTSFSLYGNIISQIWRSPAGCLDQILSFFEGPSEVRQSGQLGGPKDTRCSSSNDVINGLDSYLFEDCNFFFSRNRRRPNSTNLYRNTQNR
jgi:hypothetical protein